MLLFNRYFVADHESSYDYIVLDKTEVAAELQEKAFTYLDGRVKGEKLATAIASIKKCSKSGNIEQFHTVEKPRSQEVAIHFDVIASVCNKNEVELFLYKSQVNLKIRDCVVLKKSELFYKGWTLMRTWLTTKFALTYGDN